LICSYIDQTPSRFFTAIALTPDRALWRWSLLIIGSVWILRLAIRRPFGRAASALELPLTPMPPIRCSVWSVSPSSPVMFALGLVAQTPPPLLSWRPAPRVMARIWWAPCLLVAPGRSPASGAASDGRSSSPPGLPIALMVICPVPIGPLETRELSPGSSTRAGGLHPGFSRTIPGDRFGPVDGGSCSPRVNPVDGWGTSHRLRWRCRSRGCSCFPGGRPVAEA